MPIVLERAQARLGERLRGRSADDLKIRHWSLANGRWRFRSIQSPARVSRMPRRHGQGSRFAPSPMEPVTNAWCPITKGAPPQYFSAMNFRRLIVAWSS